MSKTKPKIAALILAAGGSARFGRPKQLALYLGQTLVRRAAAASLAVADPVFVIVGAAADLVQTELADLPVKIVSNEQWSRGIGSSIRRGVREVMVLSPEIEFLLITLCDQPLVDGNVLARLIDAQRASAKSICAAEYQKTIGPPVLVARSLFGHLLDLEDVHGAKQIWLNHPDDLCRVSCPEGVTDVDTPLDAARLPMSEQR